MRVGIITLNGYFNYGNRLQNYALQKFLISKNIDVCTICHVNIKTRFKNFAKNLFPINQKFKKFKKLYYFTKKNIKTEYISNMTKIANKYDYFICGSDQVWNYTFKSFNDDYFLNFSEKERNISYAASFGINNINAKNVERYKVGLNNFKYISVREYSAKKIINEIDNSLKVEVVVDPTLLLPIEQWNQLVKKSKISINYKYILVYMLGDTSDEILKIIKNISSENNCQIINLLDVNSPFFSCSVEDFLLLEKNAFLICTDSYHATIFSIIFNTPFLVFERNDRHEKMNSRINTLLQLTNLESQFIKSGQKKIDFNNINFSQAKKIIEIKKNESIEFLNKALNDKYR